MAFYLYIHLSIPLVNLSSLHIVLYVKDHLMLEIVKMMIKNIILDLKQFTLKKMTICIKYCSTIIRHIVH